MLKAAWLRWQINSMLEYAKLEILGLRGDYRLVLLSVEYCANLDFSKN